MGQHWLNPPHLMPLCEIIRGEQTQQPYVEQMYQLVKDLGKEPVIVKKDITGFLANRLQYAMLREALYLVEEARRTWRISTRSSRQDWACGIGAGSLPGVRFRRTGYVQPGQPVPQ